ncbi:hypothetical protein [Pseudomonas costantinii]|uniref:hypothetical protein n=1 Tax=Pseudomonas costantinii TaxID=168469 RepID=UPI0015A359CC|nr:hypothetical protein [Pseudomonas costantinii]NVZ72799.1 hypothetical protein [Pseudomonas costantinii]
MKDLRNGLYGTALVLAAAGLGGCASSMTVTGEPGVKMGDSYAQVLAVVSRNNAVTKQVDGQGFRAEGYSAMFKDCRTKYFLFQGADGLQRVSYEPAPHLSMNQNCRQPQAALSSPAS